MIYRIDTPYPKVDITNLNLEEALLVLKSYSGEVSENTAIHLYLYQAFSLKNTYPEHAKIIEQIAIVEMKHLELLANVIHLLGFTPAFVLFKNKKLIPWNASYVNYTLNLEEMMLADIASEQGAIKDYNELIETLSNESIKNLIRRIIQDEELHLSIFKHILKEVKIA